MNKLREAAQFLLTAVEDEGVRGMDTALDALRDALAEDRLNEMQSLTESEYREPEYQLVGRFTGTLSGRFVFAPEDNKIWPVGTALYARVEK